MYSLFINGGVSGAQKILEKANDTLQLAVNQT